MSNQKHSIIFNGNNFSDLESFFSEVDHVLTKNLDWKTGHNLNAFNDLLRGGFGVHEYEEPVQITWKNAEKSKIDLGPELFNDIISLIKEHAHIEFVLD